MNTEISIAQQFALDNGYDTASYSVIYKGDKVVKSRITFEGYDVFDADFKENQCVGLPAYILIKHDIVRFATPEEVETIMKIVYT